MQSNTFAHCSFKHGFRYKVKSACRNLVIALAALASISATAYCQVAEDAQAKSIDPRHAAFEKQMKQVRLKGRFTVVGQGKSGAGQEEEYVIQSVKKLPAEDKWLFMATIKYGKVNLTVPLSLNVHWAKSTPVITLDSLKILGLGTFSARVLIHDDRYSGTWQHDKTGGHLFGVIESIKAKPSDGETDGSQTKGSDTKDAAPGAEKSKG